MIRVIVKWDKKAGEAVLFFPEMAANPGNMVCYAHVGQHGESSHAYYRDCRRINSYFPSETHAARELIAEYEQIAAPDKLGIVYKDKPEYQAERWRKCS